MPDHQAGDFEVSRDEIEQLRVDIWIRDGAGKYRAMTPKEKLEVAERILYLAQRIEKRAAAQVGYKWILEDARELIVIGFDLAEEAKEVLPED